MKKFLITLAVSVLMAVSYSPAQADNIICVEQYGGGQVCGETTEPIVHEPIETAIGDFNLYIIAGGSLAIATIFYLLSKKVGRNYLLDR